MNSQIKENNSTAEISTITIPNSSDRKFSQQARIPEKVAKCSRRYIGIIFALVCSLTYSLSTLLVKLLQKYDPFLVGVWRFQGILWPSFILLGYSWGYQEIPVFKPIYTENGGKTSFLLCCRWFFSTTAFLLQFFSLQYISLADSIVVTFSTPVFVTLVAHKLLGEQSGIIPILCAMMTLLGVGVISRPGIITGNESPFEENVLIGISFALGSMICTGIAFVLMRYLRKVHISVMMTFFGIWGTVECVLLTTWFNQTTNFLPSGAADTWIVIGLTSLSFISQSSLVLALKFEEASVVAVFRTADVIFGFVWQWMILGQVPDVYSIAGGTIVVVGVLILGFRKLLSQLPPDHETRKLFRCILK